MTRFERDTMIDRYLSGAMAPSEQREFLSHVERDTELGRQLQAERLIRNAVRTDRTAANGPSAASRGEFLSMLAAVTAEERAMPAPQKSSSFRRAFNNGYLRGSIVLIAGALLGYGGLSLLPEKNAATGEGSPSAIERTTGAPAVQAPPSGIPSEVRRETNAPQAAPTDVATPAEPSAPATTPAATPERPARHTETAVRESRGTRNTPNAPSVSTASAPRERHAPLLNDSARGSVNQRAPIIRR